MRKRYYAGGGLSDEIFHYAGPHFYSETRITTKTETRPRVTVLRILVSGFIPNGPAGNVSALEGSFLAILEHM